MQNFLTIDVEEHFQVSAFEDVVQPGSWGHYESRVEENTQRILEMLGQKGVTATFFIVGWVAERHPELVKKIQKAGHEIGCHSFFHRKVYDLSQEEFRRDTLRAKDVLENITGEAVLGYRAPSYSITAKSLWAFEILQELGFKYDSSVFPIYHDTYGIPDAPRFPYTLIDSDLIEFPISTARIFGRNVPVAGGGYFRLFPYWFTKWALKSINEKEEQPFIFYLHPWELDPAQPRFQQAGFVSRFRHYNNLEKTTERFGALLEQFNFRKISD